MKEKIEKKIIEKELSNKETFLGLKNEKPEMLKVAKELLDNKFDMITDILKKLREGNWDKYDQLSHTWILNDAKLDLATYHDSDHWFEELDSGVKYDSMDLDLINDFFGYKDRGNVSHYPPLSEENWAIREHQKQITLRNALYEHGLLPRGLKGGILPEYLVEPWMEGDLEKIAMKPNQIINIFRGKNDIMWKRSYPARSLQFNFFSSTGKKIDFEKLLKIQLQRLEEGKIEMVGENVDEDEDEDEGEGEEEDSDLDIKGEVEEINQIVEQYEDSDIEENFLPKKLPLKKEKESKKRKYTSESIMRAELSDIHEDIKQEFEEWSKTDDGKEAIQLLLKDPISNPIFLERHLAGHFPFAVTNSDSGEGFLTFKEMIDKVLYLITGEKENGSVDTDPFKKEREEKKEREKKLEAGKIDRKKYPIEIKTFDFIEPNTGITKKKREYWKRKVVLKIWLPSLKLPKVVYKRVTELAGKRYTPHDQILYLPGDIYPNQKQNKLYLFGLVKKLLTEAFLAHPQYVATTQEQSSLLIDILKENHSSFFQQQLVITAKYRDAVIFRVRNLPDPLFYQLSSNIQISSHHFTSLINQI